MIRPIVGHDWWGKSIRRGLGIFTVQAAILMFVTLGVARSNQLAEFTQPAPELLPGSNYGMLTGCDPLHDGYFRCVADGYDGDVALLVDGSTSAISNTSVLLHGEPLGNLILSLGTPSGYRMSDHLVEIVWGDAIANLRQCELQSDTPVFEVMYSPAETTALMAWHGLTGELANCTAG
jgi:hypothetical protein